MSDIIKRQWLFLQMVARLIEQARLWGFQLTGGDLYRDPRASYGSTTSKHRDRLAIDLNLFLDGEYLSKTEDHRPLGEFWESLGGVWGGRFHPPDGNHYEL